MQKINVETEKKFLEAEKLRNSGKHREAIEILEKIIQQYPNFLPAINNIALNYINLKKFDEAEKYYKICLSIKPDELIFINNLAKVFHDINAYKKAIPLLQKSLNINSNQIEIMRITAKCLFEIDFRKELDVFFSKALKVFPNDKTLSYYYGRNLLRMNKHTSGLSILKETIGVIEFDEKRFKVL